MLRGVRRPGGRLLVHPVGLHIVEQHLAVLLLLLLDVAEHIAGGPVLELKDAGIVQGGNVLFPGQHIRAQEAVVLLFLAVAGIGGGEAGRPGSALLCQNSLPAPV